MLSLLAHSLPPPALAAGLSPGCALDLQGLSYRTRRGETLLQAMTLSVPAGARLAVVGPNGAGKSTLLRLLAGVLAPSSGRILIGGQDLSACDPQARARIVAWLAQESPAEVRLRVKDFVALGHLPHRRAPTVMRGSSAAQVQAHLSRCGLLTHQDKLMSQLSGGERQRAQLARVLAQSPKVLLLDEPTNHLDPQAAIDLLGRVAQAGMTVVAVLHDLCVVPEWATHVAVVAAGALVICDHPTRALTTARVQQVFGTAAFYLPHPVHARPMLVLDRTMTLQPGLPARLRHSPPCL